jgi:hypothetical protein
MRRGVFAMSLPAGAANEKPTLVRWAYAVFPVASSCVWLLRGIPAPRGEVLLLDGFTA